MSWLFSQALVAEYSGVNCSDGALSAPLSVMPTPHKFWRNDKMMAASRLSQFGLTCVVLTDDRGKELLTSYLADSRAKIYPQRDLELELMGNGLDSGEKWHELSVKYDLASSSWRTHQCLFPEALPWSSVILPKWGMTRNGVVYQHPTLMRPISETASGFWPTPTVCGNYNLPGSSKNAGMGLASAVKMWSTPSATDGTRGGKITEGMSGTSLAQQVNTPTKWPTPRVSSKNGSGPSRVGHRIDLQTAVKMWPTPTASDHHDRGNLSNPCIQRRIAIKKQIGLSMCVSAESGQLNPEWVEWLMGWPIGWTELKPLGMDKFREWQQQHNIS
ncbi:hypothetical protein R6242_09530 [Iodobacter sp. CM08]|nr:hypothetical protein [Iodobacter sp. CM08]MDW5416804.1 hypothetical protein [Iodobacter sp. CM08]